MKDSMKRFFAFRKLVSGPVAVGEPTALFVFAMFVAFASMTFLGMFSAGSITIVSMFYLDRTLQMDLWNKVFLLKKNAPIEAKTYKKYIWCNWLVYPVTGMILTAFMYCILSCLSMYDYSTITIIWLVAFALILPNSLLLFGKSKVKGHAFIISVVSIFVRIAQHIILFSFYFRYHYFRAINEEKLAVVVYIAWAVAALGIIGSIRGFVSFARQVGRIREKNYDRESNFQAVAKTIKEKGGANSNNSSADVSSIGQPSEEIGGEILSQGRALKIINWKFSEGSVLMFFSALITYPIYGGIMRFGIGGEMEIGSILYGGLTLVCILIFQTVFSALGDQKNNIDALPIELGRFVRKKVVSYLLICMAIMGAMYVAALYLPSQSIGGKILIHRIMVCCIVILISIICGCMKTVMEAFGAMICVHVLSMFAMALYMVMEESLSSAIYVGYFVLYIGILCTVMFLMIAKRVKKKNGNFG